MRTRKITALAPLAMVVASGAGFALAASACINTPPVVDEGGDSGFVIPTEDGSLPFGDGGQHDAPNQTDSAPPADAPIGPDGGGADVVSGGDSAAVDASDGSTSGPVTVVVVTANGPEPGAAVVFQGADGSVVTTGTTSASGSVTEIVAPGSQVTAVLGTPTSPNLVTIVAVEPGDVLTVLDTSVYPIGTGLNVTATSMPNGAPDTTNFFNLFAGTCNGNAKVPPVSLVLGGSCVAGGKFPLLLLAEGDGSELAFAYEKANSALDAGVSEDSGTANVNVAIGGTWATGTAVTLTADNVPSFYDGVLAYGEVSGSVAYEQLASLSDEQAPPDGGALSAPLLAHTGYPDFVQTEANVALSNDNILGGGSPTVSVLAIATRASATAPATAFDFSQALPTILSPAVAYTDSPAQATVSWAVSAPTPVPAGSISVLTWSASEGDGGEQSGTWTVVAPPTMTAIQLPALPAPLAAWAASGEDVTWRTPLVGTLGGPLFTTGYAALRAASASAWAPATGAFGNGYVEGALLPPLPAAGTIYLSAALPESPE